MKTITELNALLSEIAKKGYTLKDSDLSIVEDNLKRFRGDKVREYNTLNMDIKEDTFNLYKEIETPLKEYLKAEHPQITNKELKEIMSNYTTDKHTERVIKDFAEIESEVKNHFSKFGNEDKVKQLINNKIRLVYLWSYDLRNKPKLKELLESRKGKNILTIIHPNKVVISGSVEVKEYSTGKEWYLKNYEQRETIKELLLYVCGIDTPLDFLKSSFQKEDYFKEYEERGLMFETLKNGSVVIRETLKKGNNAIEQINNAIKTHLTKEHILVVEETKTGIKEY